MEKKKKIKISALATGTLALGAFAGNQATAKTVDVFEDLGSGAEFRSELLANSNTIAFIDNREMEMSCGEGTCGEKPNKVEDGTDEEAESIEEVEMKPNTGEKATQQERDDARSKAENRDGQQDEEGTLRNSDGKASDGKTSDDKATEHKCGEGTCG